MKQFTTYFILVSISLLTACSRYVDDRTSSSSGTGSGTGTTTPVTPPGGGSTGGGSGSGGGTGGSSGGTTNATTPFIKFFNVVDFGNLSVSLNGSTVGSIARFYPSAYITGVAGSNTITVALSGTTVLNVAADFVAGNYYSCFFYKVGNEWKVNVVRDVLTTPTTGYASFRVLDFRTQAYFDYIKVRVYAPLTVNDTTFTKRNFLDHATYSAYTAFTTFEANNSYNCVVANDTANLATKKGFALSSGKIYSLILMTPASLSSANAIYNIAIDVQQHN